MPSQKDMFYRQTFPTLPSLGFAGEHIDRVGIFLLLLKGLGHIFSMYYKNSTSSASLTVVTLPEQHGFCYNSFFLLTEM